VHDLFGPRLVPLQWSAVSTNAGEPLKASDRTAVADPPVFLSVSVRLLDPLDTEPKFTDAGVNAVEGALPACPTEAKTPVPTKHTASAKMYTRAFAQRLRREYSPISLPRSLSTDRGDRSGNITSRGPERLLVARSMDGDAGRLAAPDGSTFGSRLTRADAAHGRAGAA
jgi:hypothetical protein